MKSIFLSVVIISALVISALGGTFATWSDSETLWHNQIKTGSLDLLLNGKDDLPWGSGTAFEISLTDIIPAKWYYGGSAELWNVGQYDTEDGDAHAYIWVKNIACGNIAPNDGGYPDPSSNNPWSGDLKPEPELVAEYEGKVNSHYVYGYDHAVGDDTSLKSHIKMAVTNTAAPGPYDAGIVYYEDFLYKYAEGEKYLFDLEPNEARTIHFWFYMVQLSEDVLGWDDIIVHPNDMTPVPTGTAYQAALLHWKKFNDWPSWALMKDWIWFDAEFDLWLEDP
jgi:predicted ribosomally synthesized peptide with SipW-like signal peptide